MAPRIEELVARNMHLASKGMALKCIVARRMAHLQTTSPLISDGVLKRSSGNMTCIILINEH
jgi:hypothetical protein